jgi:osmotically inducible protein OsmC
MERTASAVWNGSLKDGKGTISTQSQLLHDAPEELIGAAHAGCYTMALSAQLGTMHAVPEKLATTATVTLENLSGSWTISKIHLDVTAKVPGLSKEAFDSAAASAKANCPVSRLLKAEISLTTTLES